MDSLYDLRGFPVFLAQSEINFKEIKFDRMQFHSLSLFPPHPNTDWKDRKGWLSDQQYTKYIKVIWINWP